MCVPESVDKMDDSLDFLGGCGVAEDLEMAEEVDETADAGGEVDADGKPIGKRRTKGENKPRAKKGAKAEGEKGARRPKMSGGTERGAGEDDEKMKCTGHCKKTLDMCHFNQDQIICKSCFNETRKWKRLIEAQKEQDWWDALKANSPRDAQKTMDKIGKHCKENKAKDKFNILNHKRRLKKASGVRKARKSGCGRKSSSRRWRRRSTAI